MPGSGVVVSLDVQGIVEGLEKLERHANSTLVMALQQGAEEVVVEAKQNHEYGDRTGRLTQSIRAEKVTGTLEEGFSVNLIAGGMRVTYAAHVEFGTRPHIIEPKKKKALRFIQGGKTRFARRVRHPGTRAYRFMQNAVEAKTGRIEKLLDTAFELAMERSGLK